MSILADSVPDFCKDFLQLFHGQRSWNRLLILLVHLDHFLSHEQIVIQKANTAVPLRGLGKKRNPVLPEVIFMDL